MSHLFAKWLSFEWPHLASLGWLIRMLETKKRSLSTGSPSGETKQSFPITRASWNDGIRQIADWLYFRNLTNLHAKLITFQCIQCIYVTDNDLADRWLAIARQEGRISASKVCLQTLPFHFPLLAIFSPFPKQRACSQVNAGNSWSWIKETSIGG